MGKDPFGIENPLSKEVGDSGVRFGPNPATAHAAAGIAQGFGQTFFPAYEQKRAFELKKAENLPARWDMYQKAMRAMGLQDYIPQKPERKSFKEFRADYLKQKGITLDEGKFKRPRQLRRDAQLIDVVSNLNKISPTETGANNNQLANQISTMSDDELKSLGISTPTARNVIEGLARNGQVQVAAGRVVQSLDEAIAYYRTTPQSGTVNSLVEWQKSLVSPEQKKAEEAEKVKRAARFESRAARIEEREVAAGERRVEQIAQQTEDLESRILAEYDRYNKGFSKEYKEFWKDVLYQTPDLETILALQPRYVGGAPQPGSQISAKDWITNFRNAHDRVIKSVEKTTSRSLEQKEDLEFEEQTERKSTRDNYVGQTERLFEAMTGDLDRVDQSPEGKAYRVKLNAIWNSYVNTGGAYFNANMDLYQALDAYDSGQDTTAANLARAAQENINKVVPMTLEIDGELVSAEDILSQENGYEKFLQLYKQNLAGYFMAWNNIGGAPLTAREANEYAETQVDLLDESIRNLYRYRALEADPRLSGLTKKRKRQKLIDKAFVNARNKEDLLAEIIGFKIDNNPTAAQQQKDSKIGWVPEGAPALNASFDDVVNSGFYSGVYAGPK